MIKVKQYDLALLKQKQQTTRLYEQKTDCKLNTLKC